MACPHSGGLTYGGATKHSKRSGCLCKGDEGRQVAGVRGAADQKVHSRASFFPGDRTACCIVTRMEAAAHHKGRRRHQLLL